jgi:hypothetical protein
VSKVSDTDRFEEAKWKAVETLDEAHEALDELKAASPPQHAELAAKMIHHVYEAEKLLSQLVGP